MEIQIHQLPADFLITKTRLKNFCREAAGLIGLEAKRLEIVVVDDPTIQRMHAEYLNDPEPTDIITFNVGDNLAIEGEIYISKDTALEQAKFYRVAFEVEVLRLIAHGLLHLKGFDDQDELSQKLMHQQEDFILSSLAEYCTELK